MRQHRWKPKRHLAAAAAYFNPLWLFQFLHRAFPSGVVLTQPCGGSNFLGAPGVSGPLGLSFFVFSFSFSLALSVLGPFGGESGLSVFLGVFGLPSPACVLGSG